MCLLVISIPSESSPLIICSNRDEFFDRPTIPGSHFKSNNRYMPIDSEGGGSWISIDGSYGRYAIVLNFDEWRLDDNVTNDIITGRNKNQTNFLSRGILIKSFLNSEPGVSALQFAREVSPASFRGFNLVVGDSQGCYFISNYPISEPQVLEPGRLYGISNGPLDAWDKVQVCKDKVGQVLKNYIQVNQLLSEDDARTLGLSLVDVMSDSKPLADPNFGFDSEIHTKLAAIFNVPVLDGGKLYGTRTITVMVSFKCVEDAHTNVLILEKDYDTANDTWHTTSFVLPFVL